MGVLATPEPQRSTVRENAICPPSGAWTVNVLETMSGAWRVADTAYITIQTAQSEQLITI
jgi:hypothetical protein